MNEKTYNEVFAACQAGGMSNDASHELAMEKACTTPKEITEPLEN